MAEVKKIHGLENHTFSEIKAYCESVITWHKEFGDIQPGEVENIALIAVGSRLSGTHRKDSDFDVLLIYSGDIREDDLHSILHSDEETDIEQRTIEDFEIDFVVMSRDKWGDVSEILQKDKPYIIL